MIAGVLLAAGASSRMGKNKALVRAGRSSFLVHGVRHLWTACDSVVVVLGANAAEIRRRAEEEFEALVEGGALREDLQYAHRHGSGGLEVHFVVNTRWKRGMYSSVRLGLREALSLEPAGVMVLPVDHPDVKPVTVASLAQVMLQAIVACRAKERAAFSYALVPRHARHRGHPLALTPALARSIAGDDGAEDLSDAVRRHARLVGYIDVADPGVVRNRNTPRS
jgi:molybdenum cofactor cytidylyltransferase